jgi:hypothetical protein
MSKQLNQYALVFNRESTVTDEQGKEYDAGFQAAAMAIAVSSWMLANKIDFVGAAIPAQPAEAKPQVTVNVTAEGAEQLAKAFNGKLAEVQLVKENVFTDPGPYVKKTRRPGFES